MNKVVTINLNGNAYQLEEAGFDALRAYLDTATARLENNPDRAEIMSDLEQAIAEKCSRYVGPHKNVVTTAEIERIIAEMGPVNGEEDEAQPGQQGASSERAGPRMGAPRRLYQIREGAMISGVCTGLAAYFNANFNIDVTLVRVAFVFLAIVTSGGWILAYLLMMFIVPEAHSSEERAAAHGQPFNAQQLVDRAKQQYAEFRENSSQWQEKWRRRREERRQRRAARAMAQPVAQAPHAPETASYATRVFAGFMVPVFTFLSAALFVGLVIALIALFKTGGVFHWSLPNDIPIWVAIIVLVLVYHAISTPLRAASRASYEASAGARYGWLAAADGLMWLAFAALLFWLAYLLIPEVKWLIHSPFEWEHPFWSWFV
jgi:phage shock protein PspC (stress-responsive transcriptional regulator)